MKTTICNWIYNRLIIKLNGPFPLAVLKQKRVKGYWTCCVIYIWYYIYVHNVCTCLCYIYTFKSYFCIFSYFPYMFITFHNSIFYLYIWPYRVARKKHREQILTVFSVISPTNLNYVLRTLNVAEHLINDNVNRVSQTITYTTATRFQNIPLCGCTVCSYVVGKKYPSRVFVVG